jgi:predicted lipoprotein with Yx(FWY)xxD motif
VASVKTVASGAASVAAALVLAVGLSACGADTGAASQARPAVVKTAVIPGLGRVLVDGSGYTLYAYTPDRRGRSRCFGMCAHQWPPLDLPAGQHPAAGPGVKPALLGTVRRAGGRQVTYDRWPLYTFINDAAPGQASGQADDMGVWYAISADGAIDRNTVRGPGNG